MSSEEQEEVCSPCGKEVQEQVCLPPGKEVLKRYLNAHCFKMNIFMPYANYIILSEKKAIN